MAEKYKKIQANAWSKSTTLEEFCKRIQKGVDAEIEWRIKHDKPVPKNLEEAFEYGTWFYSTRWGNHWDPYITRMFLSERAKYEEAEAKSSYITYNNTDKANIKQQLEKAEARAKFKEGQFNDTYFKLEETRAKLEKVEAKSSYITG